LNPSIFDSATLLASSETLSNMSNSPVSAVAESKVHPAQGDIAGIDSALMSALRDPRERLPLFRLEKALVEWMQERDGEWIEVGGPFNSRIWKHQQAEFPPNDDMVRTGSSTSFQRCVLHRLADRFGIIREQGSYDMIRLIRLPESRIPNELLQDLDPAVYSTADSEVKIKPRKMKIMKRNKNPADGPRQPSNQDGNKGTRQSLSDKEKAYAEARARIFQESESEDLSCRDATLDSLTQDLSDLNTQEIPIERQTSRNSTGSLNSSTSSNNVSSNANSNINKAVYRNYAEEVADPDFQRSYIPRVPNSNLMASAPVFTPGNWRPMSEN
jgi:hypothetical protein